LDFLRLTKMGVSPDSEDEDEDEDEFEDDYD
jgi:hypothetical protein